MGYWQAGFHVTGVDREEHDDFPFRFIRADALDVLSDVSFVQRFDFVHLSPPCQKFSPMTSDKSRHPDLIAPCRDLVQATGVPYVIENVPQAPLLDPVQLCGSSFGLRVRRHRHFEPDLPLVGSICDHKTQGQPVGVYGDHFDTREYFRPDGTRRGGKARSLEDGQDAMGGLWWMSWQDLKEAIPAQFTEYLGRQAKELLTTQAQAA